MANDSAEAEVIIEACAEATVTLMVAYRSQFEPHNREAIRMVRSRDSVR